MTVQAALLELFRNPGRLLLRRWNWKAAIFSPIFRSIIFLCANLTAGWSAVLGAMSAEFIYRCVTAGFYGALTQAFRSAEPPLVRSDHGAGAASAGLSFHRVCRTLAAGYAEPDYQYRRFRLLYGSFHPVQLVRNAPWCPGRGRGGTATAQGPRKNTWRPRRISCCWSARLVAYRAASLGGRPVKTLHLTNGWHPDSGGIATFYRELMRAANARRHQMRLIVPAESSSVQDIGEYARIYSICSPLAPLNRSYRLLYPHSYLAPGGAIHRILSEERPDLVEVCDKYSLPYLGGLLRLGALPRLNLRPAVVGLSCERMDENVAAYLSPSATLLTLSRLYMKWLYFPQCDHHITVSDHAAGELREASRGHKVRRGVWICPMGVDCALFSPKRRSPEARARVLNRTGGGERTSLLLYAGRLVPEKNLDLLIETMEFLQKDTRRDYRLVVAGSGILAGDFRTACRQRLPGRVTFFGHLRDRPSLADLYANTDVFVHPNPREPFGIAPLEAMASGAPLVAPNTGGVTSYAHDRNAWLTDPRAGTFAEAIRQASQNDAARAAKLGEALATAHRFSWEGASNRFLDLYEHLLASCHDRVADGPAPRFFSTPGDWLGRELVS